MVQGFFPRRLSRNCKFLFIIFLFFYMARTLHVTLYNTATKVLGARYGVRDIVRCYAFYGTSNSFVSNYRPEKIRFYSRRSYLLRPSERDRNNEITNPHTSATFGLYTKFAGDTRKTATLSFCIISFSPRVVTSPFNSNVEC